MTTNVCEGKRIVIADDAPEVAALVSLVLEKRGFEVIHFDNGARAFEAIPDLHPDLILLDIIMPGMNGLDVCAALKDDPATKEIPIIIITSATQGSDIADGFWNMGAASDDFLTKPFHPDALNARIDRLLFGVPLPKEANERGDAAERIGPGMSELLFAAYLGLVQGVTEFLPVSSSGHLALSQVVFRTFGLELEGDDLFFNVLIHLGTLFVVLAYYRRELIQFVREWIGGSHGAASSIQRGDCRRWTGYILASTFMTMALALPFEDRIEEAFTNPLRVGIGLLFTATILLVSWKVSLKSSTTAEGRPLTLWKAIMIGAAQAISVIPGVSRSGTTIAVALLLGVKREEAVTYSFLLSIPAILGGALLTARKVEEIQWSEPLVGMFVAAIFGWLALSLLVRWVVQGRLIGFSIYCFILGGATVAVSLLTR